MATDVARSIVNEARVQMSKTAAQSRAVLRLKSLTIEPQPVGGDDMFVDFHMYDVYRSEYALGKSANGKVVLKGSLKTPNFGGC